MCEAATSARQVAAYILDRRGPMTAMKLQKLVYYSQAWHLVWEECPLFSERIEAWANGPVVRELYNIHRGKFELRAGDIAGEESALTDRQRKTIDRVVDFYGGYSSQDLSTFTHAEQPWRDARNGLPPGERCSEEISTAAMAEYYDSLT